MGRNFENRKHSMAKTGAHKIKVYSKFAKEIYVAAKAGGVEVDGNPNLRRVIDKAKKEQVPSHVIDNALKKAKGGGGEDNGGEETTAKTSEARMRCRDRKGTAVEEDRDGKGTA